MDGAQLSEQPFFSCHQGMPGDYDAWAICAGWLAVCGGQSLSVMLEVRMYGGIPEDALAPGDNWPPLHPSWDAMVAAQTWKPGDPADHLPPEWRNDHG